MQPGETIAFHFRRSRLAAVIALGAATLLLSRAGAAAAPGDGATTTILDSDGRQLTIPLRLDQLATPRATASERAKFQDDMVTTRIPASFRAPLTPEKSGEWDGGFWGTRLLYLRNDLTRNAVRRGLRAAPRLDREFERSALETAYAVFPKEYVREVSRVARTTTNPKNFAMAAHYLSRARGAAPAARRSLRAQLRDKFPGLRLPDSASTAPHPILRMLDYDLSGGRDRDMRRRPSLDSLLARDFLPGQPVLFSFQRRNRVYPGLAMVRRPDGTFVRQPDGTLFALPHLGMSLGNHPGYLTNGNTPQGIHSILGVGVTRNVFIGRTPFLHSTIPFEVTPPVFLHLSAGTPETSWTLEAYTGLLPAPWRGHFPMLEAYYAGEAGRSEMLCHGTTADPEPYRGMPCYPNTPSLGCMTAQELWSGRDGHALASDQLAILKAWLSAGNGRGFLVVVELDGETRPVDLADVRWDVLKADEAARTR